MKEAHLVAEEAAMQIAHKSAMRAPKALLTMFGLIV